MNEFHQIRDQLRAFSAARDWDQYHNPKNLVMAMSVEASELLECFQWLTPEQSKALSKDQQQAVQEEIADVQMYLIRLADTLDIDIPKSVAEKMIKNAKKYPPL